MSQCPTGIPEAQCREPLSRLLRTQRGIGGAQPGDGRQQRAVEELFVDPAHRPGVELPVLDDVARRVVAQADGSAQPAQVLLGSRHDMGPPQPVELDPVLQGPQQAIGLVEGGGVLAPDVPAASQCGQGLQRRRGPQRRVVTAVHELQQLHAEFDVT